MTCSFLDQDITCLFQRIYLLHTKHLPCFVIICVSVKPRVGLKPSINYERMIQGTRRLPSSRCESMGVSAFIPGSAIDCREVVWKGG